MVTLDNSFLGRAKTVQRGDKGTGVSGKIKGQACIIIINPTTFQSKVSMNQDYAIQSLIDRSRLEAHGCTIKAQVHLSGLLCIQVPPMSR